MIFVSCSAFLITPWRAFIDPARTPSSQSFASFLAFIATLTLASLWYGLTVLKLKNRTTPSRALKHIGPPLALLGATLMIEVQGILSGQALLIAFPVLGVLVGWKQLKYWLNSPTERMHWWYAHMSGMFTACISTITAFLVTVIPRLSQAPLARSPVRWTAQYQKQFGLRMK